VGENVASEFRLDSFGNEMRPAREPKDDSMSLSVTRDILTEIDNMSMFVIPAEAGIQAPCSDIFLFGTLLDEILIIQKLKSCCRQLLAKKRNGLTLKKTNESIIQQN